MFGNRSSPLTARSNHALCIKPLPPLLPRISAPSRLSTLLDYKKRNNHLRVGDKVVMNHSNFFNIQKSSNTSNVPLAFDYLEQPPGGQENTSNSGSAWSFSHYYFDLPTFPTHHSSYTCFFCLCPHSPDPNVMTKSGRVLIVAELAREYGFKDVGGTYLLLPKPHRGARVPWTQVV